MEHAIELRIREIGQLFNSMDPSPFHEKDLDHDAEEFIVSWAQEYPSKAPLSLKVYLEKWPSPNPAEMIRMGIHNYFAYRAQISRREFRHFMKQAQASLIISVIFLAACLLIGNVFSSYLHFVWAGFIQESLTIAGWVAMWRPIQMFLYDWWPLTSQINIYHKLSQIPIEIAENNS